MIVKGLSGGNTNNVHNIYLKEKYKIFHRRGSPATLMLYLSFHLLDLSSTTLRPNGFVIIFSVRIFKSLGMFLFIKIICYESHCVTTLAEYNLYHGKVAAKARDKKLIILFGQISTSLYFLLYPSSP